MEKSNYVTTFEIIKWDIFIKVTAIPFPSPLLSIYFQDTVFAQNVSIRILAPIKTKTGREKKKTN